MKWMLLLVLVVIGVDPAGDVSAADAHLKLLLATSKARASDLHSILCSEVSVALAFHPMVSPITIGR